MSPLLVERENQTEEISAYMKRLTSDVHIKLQHAEDWLNNTAEALHLSEGEKTSRKELRNVVFCLSPYSQRAKVELVGSQVNQWVEKYPQDPLNRTITHIMKMRTKEAELCKRLNLDIEQL